MFNATGPPHTCDTLSSMCTLVLITYKGGTTLSQSLCEGWCMKCPLGHTFINLAGQTRWCFYEGPSFYINYVISTHNHNNRICFCFWISLSLYIHTYIHVGCFFFFIPCHQDFWNFGDLSTIFYKRQLTPHNFRSHRATLFSFRLTH